jgi:hypothetical protein
MSARAELARLVLQMLQDGHPVPTDYACQLRNWAVSPEEAMLALEEIARSIVNGEENSKANTVVRKNPVGR